MIVLGRRSRDKTRRAGLSPRALLGHPRHAQLVVVGGARHGSLVAGPSGGDSSAVAQACRVPVIVARRKPAGCQSEAIGDRRKISRLGRFQ
jgi:hypothetical protein